MSRSDWKGLLVLAVAGIVIGLLLYLGWVKVNWDTVVTTVVSTIIIGVLAFFGAPSYLQHLRKEGQLLAVETKRGEGVSLRNEALAPLSGPKLQDWLGKAQKWEADAADIVGKFSKVEGERVRTLDWVKLSGLEGTADPEQARLVRNMNATLWRMYELTGQYAPALFKS